MQEFLVRMKVRLDPSLSTEVEAELRAREAVRAAELLAAGTIVRLWRLPGTRSNVGIWRAQNPAELHAAISSLPMFRWIDAEVTALAPHPNDPGSHSV